MLILQQFSRKSSKKKLGSSSALSNSEAGYSRPGGGATAGLKTDKGRAMAAVDAARRNVFISTKNVVSAVAGTLKIVEARKEMLETWGFDTDDTVILTEIITREPKEETLIVISTERVVCVDCFYKGGSAPELHLLWQAPLKAIRDVDLKSTPLVLTFHIDRQAAKTADPSPGQSGVGGLGTGDGEEKLHAQPQPTRPSHQQIVQKRLLGDLQHDNVAFMRIYNIVKCLLGRLDEVDVNMGYGFGVHCNNGGFQFGVWEFALEPLRPLLTSPIPRTHGRAPGRFPVGAVGPMEADDDATDELPLFHVLEQTNWIGVKRLTEGAVQQDIFLSQSTQKLWRPVQTGPVLPPSLTVCSTTHCSSTSSTSTSTSSRKGASTAFPRTVPSIFIRGGGTDADPSSRSETDAARSSNTDRSRMHKDGSASIQLLAKIDSLEARLFEVERNNVL